MKLLDLIRLAILMRLIEKMVENPKPTVELLNKQSEIMKDCIQTLQGKEKEEK
jgi:hypothetical protein